MPQVTSNPSRSEKGGTWGCVCLVRVGFRPPPPRRGVAPAAPFVVVLCAGRPPAAPAVAGGGTGAALGYGAGGPVSANAAGRPECMVLVPVEKRNSTGIVPVPVEL